MPGLPARAGAAEALVLRQAERSLKDVLELVHAGALDPSTLGRDLLGLCEELKRFSPCPRVVDPADATLDDDEADTEKEDDPARPADGTVTPVRFAAPAPRPRRRKLGDGGEAALALGALRLSTKPMDAAWTSRGAKRNPEREPLVESESDADADGEDASRVKRRRERLCSPSPDRSGATTPPPEKMTLPDPAAAAADAAAVAAEAAAAAAAASAAEAAAAVPAAAEAAAAVPAPPKPLIGPLPKTPPFGDLEALPAEVALDIVSRLNAKELGRLEVTCRGARGTPGLVELAVLRVKRHDYAIPIPTTRENWPQVVQRWEWTNSSRSISTRMDEVAATLDSLDMSFSLGFGAELQTDEPPRRRRAVEADPAPPAL
jgi:hypothetical protein